MFERELIARVDLENAAHRRNRRIDLVEPLLFDLGDAPQDVLLLVGLRRDLHLVAKQIDQIPPALLRLEHPHHLAAGLVVVRTQRQDVVQVTLGLHRLLDLIEIDLGESLAQLDRPRQGNLLDLLFEDLDEDLPRASLRSEALGDRLRGQVGALLGECTTRRGEPEVLVTEALLLNLDDLGQQAPALVPLLRLFEPTVVQLDQLSIIAAALVDPRQRVVRLGIARRRRQDAFVRRRRVRPA